MLHECENCSVMFLFCEQNSGREVPIIAGRGVGILSLQTISGISRYIDLMFFDLSRLHCISSKPPSRPQLLWKPIRDILKLVSNPIGKSLLQRFSNVKNYYKLINQIIRTTNNVVYKSENNFLIQESSSNWLAPAVGYCLRFFSAFPAIARQLRIQ